VNRNVLAGRPSWWADHLQADTKCTERIQKGLVECTQYFCVVDIIGSSDGHNCYSPDRIVMPQDIYSTRIFPDVVVVVAQNTIIFL
jgi:hypothetical protein